MLSILWRMKLQSILWFLSWHFFIYKLVACAVTLLLKYMGGHNGLGQEML